VLGSVLGISPAQAAELGSVASDRAAAQAQQNNTPAPAPGVNAPTAAELSGGLSPTAAQAFSNSLDPGTVTGGPSFSADPSYGMGNFTGGFTAAPAAGLGSYGLGTVSGYTGDPTAGGLIGGGGPTGGLTGGQTTGDPTTSADDPATDAPAPGTAPAAAPAPGTVATIGAAIANELSGGKATANQAFSNSLDPGTITGGPSFSADPNYGFSPGNFTAAPGNLGTYGLGTVGGYTGDPTAGGLVGGTPTGGMTGGLATSADLAGAVTGGAQTGGIEGTQGTDDDSQTAAPGTQAATHANTAAQDALDAAHAADFAASKGAPATTQDMENLSAAHDLTPAPATVSTQAAQEAAAQAQAENEAQAQNENVSAVVDQLAASEQDQQVSDTLTAADKSVVAPAPGLTNQAITATVDQAIADNQAATQAAIATQTQALTDIATPPAAPAPAPAAPAPGLGPAPGHANPATMGSTPGLSAVEQGHANQAAMEAAPAAPAPGHANQAAMEAQGLGAVTQGHANQAAMDAQTGLGEKGHANEEAFESMDPSTLDPAIAPSLTPAEKAAAQQQTINSIVTQATKGITSKEDAMAKGAQARSALEKAGVPPAQAKAALTDIATKAAAALGWSTTAPFGIGTMVSSQIAAGIEQAMVGYNPAAPAAPAPAPTATPGIGHANAEAFEGMDAATFGGFPAADPSTAPGLAEPGTVTPCLDTYSFAPTPMSQQTGQQEQTPAPAPAVSPQPSADIQGRSPATIADIVDAMTQANKDQTWSTPVEVTTTTPQTTTPQTTTPQTTPQTPAPAPAPAPSQGPAPSTTSPAPGVPAPSSPAAAQAIASATQAADANPRLPERVAAMAPGLVEATAKAFGVSTQVAAMMVMQGVQNQEQEKVQQTAGLGSSSVGFSDIGTGGGGNPSTPMNVDAMVSNVMSSPTAGLGQTPGFAHGGLVRGLAAGGLAKPVASPSSISSMGQQSHFGALNVKPPRGSNLAAINVPAVQSPGAHLINSSVPGRTDRIPMRARTGSFVIPADVVSGLGEGNTMAGAKMWGQLLTHSVTGAAAAGMRRGAAPGLKGGIGRMGRITGPGSRQLPAPRPIVAPPQKVPFQDLPVSSKGLPHGFANGGYLDDMDDETTPIITAGGEMLVDPEIVAALGGGDPEAGTEILCKSIEGIRKQVQAYQKKLPGPSR